MKPRLYLLTLTSCTHLAYAQAPLPLGDEFTSAVTSSQWTQLNDTEGWNASQLELFAFNPSYSSGNMVMAPHSSAWFGDLRGVLVYKEVTGDFIVTLRMQVTRRGAAGTLPDAVGFSALTGAPSRNFSLAGIFVRSPKTITQAGPSPVPAGTPTWPPPAAGESGHFTTDWAPDNENYIFLSMGSAGNAGTWQYEVKTTRNSDSRLYYNNYGIPADDAEAQYVTLQFVKIGNTVVTLRKHHDGPWIVENRYTQSSPSGPQQLPNFGGTLQVGITTYTDWSSISSYYSGGNPATQFEHNYSIFQGGSHQPDLVAHVDYYRLARPNPALTESSLQSLPLTFGQSDAVELPNSGAGIYLGDVANIPAPSLESDPDGDGIATLIETIMGTDPAVANVSSVTYGKIGAAFEMQFPHMGNMDHVTIEIEESDNLLTDGWDTVATRTSAGWSTDPGYLIDESATDVTFTAPAATGKRFYRVRVTLP